MGLKGHPAQSSAPADAACAAAHFLLGEWEVARGDSTPVAKTLWELGPEGCYLVQTWTGLAEGVPDALCLLAYSSEKKNWGLFAGESKPGGRRSLFEDGNMVGNEFRFVTKESGGLVKGKTGRFSYFNLPDGRIRELSLLSSDGGKTWETEYNLVWQRKK